MPSFLSKQKIIQLMCVIHIFPFADPGRGEEIKDSFLFYRSVELKFDTHQLPGFSEGLLTGHRTVEGQRHGDLSIPSLGQSGCFKSNQILLFFKDRDDDMQRWYTTTKIRHIVAFLKLLSNTSITITSDNTVSG